MLTLCAAAALALSVAVHAATKRPAGTLFLEDFNTGELGQFVLSAGADYAEQPVEVDAAAGLVLKSPAKKYAVTAPFAQPITVGDLPLVLQYEVALTEGLTCGGAYVKVLNDTGAFDAAATTSATPYVLMFGPDRCGTTDKVHFIIRWKNPVTGEVEEKHLAKAPRTKQDKLSHVYTLVIRPDDTFAVKIDNTVEAEGSLASPTDFSPPVLPPAEIPDPEDHKPADWVNEEKIVDASATKPDDWDEAAPLMIPDADAVMPVGWLEAEPEFVADPSAQRPEEWDEEEDGDWTAPSVANPKCAAAPGCGPWARPTKRNPAYKGAWRAPLVDNPAYKGEWAARTIANPAYYAPAPGTLHRLGAGDALAGLAVEVWTMSGGLAFDGFLLGTDEAAAEAYAEATWRVKHTAQATEVADAARAAAAAERASLLEQGGAANTALYYLLAAKDFALENLLATAATALALLAAAVFGCYRACCGDDGAEDHALLREAEALRRKQRQQPAAAAAAAAAAGGVAAAAAEGGAHSHDCSAHGHSHGGAAEEEEVEGGGDEAEAQETAAAAGVAPAEAAAAPEPEPAASAPVSSGSTGSPSGKRGGARQRKQA